MSTINRKRNNGQVLVNAKGRMNDERAKPLWLSPNRRSDFRGWCMMSKRVVVAGHICLDITPIFTEKRNWQLTDVLAPGKLFNVGKADIHTGGSVANTGLAMKILGADVTLMGKVGDDEFGKIVHAMLDDYDAGDGLIVKAGDDTSYSVILAVPGIDRIFLHNTGANDTFCAEDIPQDALIGKTLFHFGYPPLMKSVYRNDGAELIKMMMRAKENGLATSLDFASIDPNSEAGSVDWKKILENVLPYVDFFVPSVEELCYMLDRERFDEWQRRADGRDVTEMLNIETDVKPLADQCMHFGTKVLLIKCGAPGIYYRTADGSALRELHEKLDLELEQWGAKEGFEKSYVPEKVLSGTGAGDTSIAAFLTAVLEGYSLEETMQMATATGASCVEAYDALSGLKSFEELKRKIKAGWKKNGV